MSLSKSFAGCIVTASTTQGINGLPPPSITSSRGRTTFAVTSFFVDSSGHSNFSLTLELKFATLEDLDRVMASKSIVPVPSPAVNVDVIADVGKDEKDQEEGTDQEIMNSQTSFIGFEARTTSGSETSKAAVVVEALSIRSTSVKDLVVSFETEVTVRASDSEGSLKKDSDQSLAAMSSTMVNLEITPVLTIQKLQQPPPGPMGASAATTVDIPDLLSLERGAIPDNHHTQNDFFGGAANTVHETRLQAVSLEVTLTQAFTINVESVPGQTPGQTMVSLTIKHSNLHREVVTISNIAFHPGHSRYETLSDSNRKTRNFGSKYSMTNMTKAVQWGYAPQTELRLPLALSPYDAYSTVLFMKGGEEMHSRFFTSPLSVTGVVGRLPSETSSVSPRQRVVVAADTHWTTELVAIEPADAFRISMNLSSAEVKLGESMVVSLRIFNLSLEPRNIMLLMAKEEHKGASERDDLVNAAVVSEIDGYTFGVWGISGEDDGTVRLNRDNSLLSVDGALMLGEVLGQHAIDAELRFVPLREGCLKVPCWRLYDKISGKWYSCIHGLSMVATS